MVICVPARHTPKNHPSLARDERGLSTVEYVILLVLVAVAGIVAWNSIGGTVVDKIQGSDGRLKELSTDAKKK